MPNRSRLELVTAQLLKDAGFDYAEEFEFHPTRRWRADFKVWPAADPGGHAVLVECEGLTHYGSHLGRHQTRAGYEKDLEKYNAAALLGWTVFRFSSSMIADGRMEQTLRDFFACK